MTTLAVALPTYNPRPDFLQRVLDSLRAQTVPPSRWQFILVDNNSTTPLSNTIDLSWHPNGRVLVERTQGKMHAIAAAFRNTETDLVMFLDDDTVAAADLIEQTLEIGTRHTMLGAWSPRVELELEDNSVAIPPRLRTLLSERIIDAAWWSNDPNHTPSTPWGGGMCVRRAVAAAYLAQTAANPQRLQLDPMGDQPGYGGDTDLSYTACSIGLGMGVFPQLRITHLIPARRCTLDYLLRNLEAHEFSHYMQHHARTGHWPASAGLRDRTRRWVRWAGADALARRMMAAEDRGRAAAYRTVATRADHRPVTHR
jgi:glycosyltransferase involved in cell wall biosynthesis